MVLTMTIELPNHDLDEEGDHEPDECQKCLEAEHTVVCECRCGDCCRRLIIEASLADAEREPRIAQRGSPVRDFDEVVGYLLNGQGDSLSCVFLDEASNACTIWSTRPGACRFYDCDSQRAQQKLSL